MEAKNISNAYTTMSAQNHEIMNLIKTESMKALNPMNYLL